MSKTPLAVSVSKVRALFHESGRCRTRSNSHSVVARNDCTKIPLATGGAQEDETILQCGCSSHPATRFVHLDQPRLIVSR